MNTGWVSGLFWFWLFGVISWIGGLGFYIYLDTHGFSLHLTTNDWIPYILVWFLPPILTFGVFLFVRAVGRKLLEDDARAWEPDGYTNPGSGFRHRS